MDLRPPADEWEWKDDVIPRLKAKISDFVMEYVKHTKKIYALGGRIMPSDSRQNTASGYTYFYVVILQKSVLINALFYFIRFMNMIQQMQMRIG